MIIRSHQVKELGYEYAHNQKVLTVFSASNYGNDKNWGAFLRWYESIKIKRFCFLFNYNKYFRDYNAVEPWLSQYKTESVEMQRLSFRKQ